MSKRNTLTKVGIVTTSVLFGALLIGSKIAFIPSNKTGISNALGQKDYKVINPVDPTYTSKYETLKDLMNDGKKLVEEIEAEGAVLLKNANNTLPLAKETKINLVGKSSTRPAYGGRGSAQGGAKTDPEITPLQGLQEAVMADGNSANFDVNGTAYNLYNNSKTEIWNSDIENSVSSFGGVAVYTIARTGGEGSDKSNGKDGKSADELALTTEEKSILTGLNNLKKNGKIDKIIVLMNYSNQIADFLDVEEYGIDAALWIGNPGQTGFAAVGDILAGGVNPSGHLSDMHWYNHDDNPVNKNFGAYEYEGAENYTLPKTTDGKIQPKYSTYDVYQEGMYVGYRYAETRYADVVTERANVGTFDYSSVVAHPFGYGSSYTTFEYSNFNVKENGENYEVSVDVKNTGSVAGKDAVQIYVQKPYNNRAITNKIEVPAVELVGFEKTNMIEPSKTETVKVNVLKSDLTVYDANGDKTFIINDGDYYFTAGEDSHAAINNILAAQGKTTENGMTENGNKNLTKKKTLAYDNTTYSKSRGTGAEVTNLFDQADINKFEGRGFFNKVTYISRNNWEKTLPTTNVKLKMSDGIAEALTAQDDLSRIEKSSKPYPTYGEDNGLKLVDAVRDAEGNFLAYDDPMWDKLLNQLTWEDTCKLISDGLRKTPALASIAKPGTVDHNGPAGLTEAYGTNPDGLAAKNNDPDKSKRAPYYPCAGIIAATFSPRLATAFGDMLGEDALWAGYAGLYGIAINTHRSPYEGRAFEYLSEDPFLAGRMAANESKALQAKGCNAYIKHFALNEQENVRQGVQIWLNEQTLRQIYLKPFEMAVVDGGAMNAMASFTRIGVEFNPASKSLQTDWLRGEVGMKGLVVTDMYDIGYEPTHFPTFVLAGTDLPDGSVVDVFEPFKEGYADMAWAMRESAHRVLYSTGISNAMNGMGPDTEIVPATPAWIVALNTTEIISGVAWVAMLGVAIFFAISTAKCKSKKNEE